MNDVRRWLWLTAGLFAGAFAAVVFFSAQPRAAAGNNDHYDDYILCTGTVDTVRGTPTDGIWLLDYRAGKLLGTVVDRSSGKIFGWAEVDLVSEFGLPPRQNVHFLMTTGQIARTQAALYIAETTSGKFGVYTMGMRNDGQAGIAITRHDLVSFRQPK